MPELINPKVSTIKSRLRLLYSLIEQNKALILFLTTFLLIIYPPLLLIITKGIKGAFQYFASDSYYYLTIAKNFINRPYFTFDGMYPTNGFHPLWQYYLSFSFKKIIFLQTTENQIFFTFFSCLIFVAFGVSLFSLSIIKLTNKFSLALLASIPGFYYLFFSNIAPNYGNSWSFINGMESSLTILLFGILTFLLLNKNILEKFNFWKVCLVSFLLTMISLSRLDNVFLFFPFILYVLFLSNKRKRLSLLFATCIPPTILIGYYLIYNYLFCGIIIPTSGIIKLCQLPGYNLVYLKNAIIPTAPVFLDYRWKHETYRILQVTIPTLAALFWLISKIAKRTHKIFYKNNYQENIILIFCIFVILKGSYNLIFVNLWQQGHWYFPLSIMIFNLILAISLTHFIKFKNKISKFSRLNIAIASILWIILLGNAFTNFKIRTDYNDRFFSFWKTRKETMKNIKKYCEGQRPC